AVRAPVRETEHPLELGIGANDAPVVDNGDAHGGRIEDGLLFGKRVAQKRLRSLELAYVDRGAARTDEIAFAVSQRDRVDREIHGAAVAMEKGTIHVQRRASLHQLEEFIVER